MANKSAFIPTAKQSELLTLISNHPNVMAFGGGRSGKSFAICCYIIFRALLFPGSRQTIIRSQLKTCRETMFDLTFKEALKVCAPDLHKQWGRQEAKDLKVNKTELSVEFGNGSIVTFQGLDDNGRMENILGQEYITIYLNEVSQIHSYELVGTLQSRLSQMVEKNDGSGIVAEPKFLFDCNPPSKSHWAYRAFVEGVNPIDRSPWEDRSEWASIMMNPVDNQANLAANYITRLQKTMSAKQRARFIEGKFSTEVEGALFKSEWIADARLEKIDINDLTRIIVAVDPAVSNTAKSDETGIIVAGIDAEGQVYILADRSLKGTPEQWARAVVAAYDEFKADKVVAEKNQGGDLVKTNLRMADHTLPIELVSATRGKIIRAEPVSTLYEQGKVSHVGSFKELEEQLEAFTHEYSRIKQGSPDRLDALVWAVSSLAVKNSQPSSVEHGANPFF